MNSKENATDRVRLYPTDGTVVRVLAAKRGGKVVPADIVHEALLLLTK